MPPKPLFLNPEHLVVGETWQNDTLLPHTANPLVPLPTALPPPTLWHAARLGAMRDSCGKPVTQWPTKIVPSTTVIIYRPRVQPMMVPEILLHRRADNGHWGFLGGAQNSGESIRECAIREAKEESGLDIVLEDLICIDSDPTQYALNQYADNLVQYCNVTFTAQAKGTELIASPESTALCWFSSYEHEWPTPFLPAHRWRWRAAQRVWNGGKAEVR